jgi:hypothetical protein
MELLQALVRRGKLTAVEAALEARLIISGIPVKVIVGVHHTIPIIIRVPRVPLSIPIHIRVEPFIARVEYTIPIHISVASIAAVVSIKVHLA